MVKFYESIPPHLAEWALSQPIFFTASAPLAGRHVNISPKGLPSATFTIFRPSDDPSQPSNQAAYVDATGSGCETISHIYENGRVTIMFCSFETSPRIMRFFCKGRVVEWDQPEFEKLLGRMGKERIEGARAVILLDVYKVQTSCGYGVPLLGKPSSSKQVSLLDRATLGHWASQKISQNELIPYQTEWNYNSLDGLPGMKRARRDRGEKLWLTELQASVRRIMLQKDAVFVGIVIGVLSSFLVCALLGMNW